MEEWMVKEIREVEKSGKKLYGLECLGTAMRGGGK